METKSDMSVSGHSFKARKSFEDEERGIGRPVASKVFNRVQRAKGSSSGGSAKKAGVPKVSRSRPSRPTPKGPSLKAAARRCMVKVNFVANRKAGQWAAHGKYLEREGAQKEGERGQGFNAGSDDVSLSSSMNGWQMDGDSRLFKIVLSPEDGDRLQLKDFTREFMRSAEEHIGRPLEWAAVDHYNTAHPHVHIVMRGKDNLQISPDLIRNGLRNIAEGIATERLGYKSELEIQKSREREVDARQFTGIDRDIRDRLMRVQGDSRTFITEGMLKPDSGAMTFSKPEALVLPLPDYVSQRLRIKRLDTLEKLGVAEKVGSMTWALDAGWDKALKDLQVLQQRTAMVGQGRALMTDPRCPPVVSKIKTGDHLVGRVLGTGLDEQYDRSFILIEGTDSRVHIVYQNAAIEKQRAEQKLQPRQLVAISGQSFEKNGKSISHQKITEYDLSIPDQNYKNTKIPDQALDDALDAGQKPEADKATTGFQACWHRQLMDRQIQREKAKNVEIEKERLNREKELEAKGNSKGKAKDRSKGKTNGNGIE